MAAFNTVSVKRAKPCPRCGDKGIIRLQFAYGDTYQYHYEMGETIRWGGNDVGVPVDNSIEILAYPEPCPVCGLDIDDEYVLTIKINVLRGFRLADAADVTRLDRA